MKKELSRRQGREQAFILAFERQFSTETVSELCQKAQESRDFVVDDFSMDLLNGIEEHQEDIDALIIKHSNGWKINRMSKVSLSLLQLAICEIMYITDTTNADSPVGVAINEAIELAKKYSTQEDAAFINGVLGAIAKEKIGE